MFYNKMERLEFVLQIVNKLKNFQSTNNTTINLYNENLCHFITELHLFSFTPLKIYNGTPSGVPLEIQWQQLPINELNGTPPKAACPISNLHRCKTPILLGKKIRKNVKLIVGISPTIIK